MIELTVRFIEPQYSHHPRAWLYFLSRMRKPWNLAQYLVDERTYWDDLLACSPKVMIQDLMNKGLLVECSPQEKISESMTVADLKNIAEKHGVKVPTKKAAIIALLCDRLPTEIDRLMQGLRYAKCTDAGLVEVMNYFRYEQALYNGAADQILSRLAQGDVAGAMRVGESYWQSQIFQRGNFVSDEKVFRAILGRLVGDGGLDEHDRAACLTYFLPGNYPGQWFMEKGVVS